MMGNRETDRPSRDPGGPGDDASRTASALLPDAIVTADHTYTETALLLGSDGRIVGLRPRREVADLPVPVTSLPGRALLPGFVNAHSHVFQRRLRGRTHHGLAERDSFWTWRELMYAEASLLNPESLFEIARSCYAEMLRSGYTTVGEFHYVHHAPDGTPYANHLAMSEAIIAAASETGIRLALLPVAYAQAGFGRPPEPGQRRFCFPDVESYLSFVDDLRAVLRDERHSLGVAPHSVRAVPADWLGEIATYAERERLVLHVHASEQTAEVEQALAEYGYTPIDHLEKHGCLRLWTTLIHATHASGQDCRLIEAAGATVCVCPITEGDLGDGIAPYAWFVEHNIPLATGSDGQTRIDPFEELRWAEFSARMRYQGRRVLAAGGESPGERLFASGTVNAARSLGLQTGSLEAGAWADLIAVDLEHPALLGASADDLRDTLLFGAGAEVVSDVWVAGRKVVDSA
jgi:formimidoylglutamate deiminase